MKDLECPSVEGFHRAAVAFCEWASGEEALTQSDLWRCRGLLLPLLGHVPAVENHTHEANPEGRRIDEKVFARVAQRLGGLPFNHYRIVFDPHDFELEDEPVIAMLADDLADIYRDLGEGTRSLN